MVKKRNQAIQILRVVACIMVFFVHFGQRLSITGTIGSLFDFGKYGVQLFFLISGFLAAKTFKENKKVNIKEYYIKRAITLLPLYYFVILIYFILENICNNYMDTIPIDNTGLYWFRYIFLLNGFINSDTYFWSNLGITWTIPIFAFFYLMAPFILKKVKNFSSSIVCYISIFGVSRVLNYIYECNIFTYIHYLFLGVLLYYSIKEKKEVITSLVFLVLCLVAGIFLKIEWLYVFVFCSIILLLSKVKFKLPKFLEKIINVLDKYSYTLYLGHGVIFCGILDKLILFGTSWIIILLIAIFGTCLFTFIVGKYIEKPMQRILSKKLLD